MELKQIGPKTFCIEHDTNIGIHFTDDGRMYLIDTGSKGDGEKINEILSREGWVPSCIINTHTHIDHIGGNEFLMRKYGIPAYCTDYDMALAHYSELEAAYMNGGYPAEKLRTIFAHPGMIGFRSIEKETPDGIDWTYLPGHSFGMIGIRTSDDMICETCREYRGQDEILQQMYERLRMHARSAQHALLSSTVKSYLTYLQDRNKLECRFVDNIMKWRTQE